MDTIISSSPEETIRLGETFGREAEPGWLIGVSGGLGAGKTQLVKGIAHGVGITGRVSSPTFGLMHELEGGRLPLVHMDLYRLAAWADVQAAGLDEYMFGNPGVVVVEWIERALDDDDAKRVFSQRQGLFRHVTIGIHSDSERRINYEDSCH